MSDEQVKVHFANKLRELREAAGLSQEELGEKIGCSRGSISYYEKSQRVPDIIILKKASDFFNVSPAYLLGMGVKSPDPDAEIAVQYTGLSEENIEFLNRCVRLRDAYMNEAWETVSDEDSALLAPGMYIRFVNEMIETSRSDVNMIADYCSLDMQNDFEAMSQLGPGLCRDLIRFKASEVGRAIERHLLERIDYGND